MTRVTGAPTTAADFIAAEGDGVDRTIADDQQRSPVNRFICTPGRRERDYVLLLRGSANSADLIFLATGILVSPRPPASQKSAASHFVTNLALVIQGCPERAVSWLRPIMRECGGPCRREARIRNNHQTAKPRGRRKAPDPKRPQQRREFAETRSPRRNPGNLGD